MMLATIILATIFGLFAGVFAMYAFRAGKGQIPFGAPTPLIGSKLRQNAENWFLTHRRAAPNLWTAAAVSLIQATVFAFTVAYPTMMTRGYLIALAVTGLTLIGTSLVLGGRQ